MNSVISRPGKPGVYGGVAGTQRSTSLCNLALVFPRDKTRVCPARRGVRVATCAFARVCVETRALILGSGANNNRPNRAGFHRSLQPQTFVRFPPPADTVMDGSRQSAPQLCTGARIIVYSTASNLWRELDCRGPVLKTTSVSHRNGETNTRERERDYPNVLCLTVFNKLCQMNFLLKS